MNTKYHLYFLMGTYWCSYTHYIFAVETKPDFSALEREVNRSNELIAQMKVKLAILQTAVVDQEKPEEIVSNLIEHDKYQLKQSQDQLKMYRSQGLTEFDPHMQHIKDKEMQAHLELHELEHAAQPQIKPEVIQQMAVRKERRLKNFVQEHEQAVEQDQKKLDEHRAHAMEHDRTSQDIIQVPQQTKIVATHGIHQLPQNKEQIVIHEGMHKAPEPAPTKAELQTGEPIEHMHGEQPPVTAAHSVSQQQQPQAAEVSSANHPSVLIEADKAFGHVHKISAERGPGPFTHNFSGFVKYDAFWDTRQTIGMREDVMLKFPEPRIPDSSVIEDGKPAGPDINDRGQFTQLACLTRLRLDVFGPDVFKAKASAVIESDFFGAWVIDNFTDSQVDHVSVINGLSLRLAYINLAWEHWALLFGQQWHPFSDHHGHHSVAFMRDVFESMTFNPQIRVTTRYGCFEAVGAAIGQLDWKTFGVDSFSTKYLRNAIIPNFAGQLKFYTGLHEFCVGLDFKTIIPRLSVDKINPTTGRILQTFAVNEFVNSLSASAYASLNWDPASLFLHVTYGENLQDHMMLGGYVATQEGFNPTTGQMKYTNIRNLALVADFAYKRKNVEPGLFVGITKNLGANKIIFTDSTAGARIFSLGTPHHPTNAFNRADIDTLLAVAPRVIWYIRPLVLAAEVKFLRAAYGQVEPAPSRGRVINTEFVNLFRFAFSAYYLF